MEESPNEEDEQPIILGRAFMATAGTKIDVQKGILTMSVFETTIGFRIFDAMKSPLKLGECFRVEVVEDLVESIFIESSFKDPFLASIAQHGREHMNKKTMEGASSLKSLPTISSSSKEHNPPPSKATKEKIKTSRKVVGKGKRKKKIKRYTWLQRLTPKFLIPNDCFGDGGCGKRNTVVSGKKKCFEPP
jgi:hypothetical protein